MQKSRSRINAALAAAVTAVMSAVMMIMIIFFRRYDLMALGQEHMVEILLEQIASAFLIISIIAVLSDRSNIILWENMVQLKLIEPIGFNLVDLSIYVFTIIGWSVVSVLLGMGTAVIVLAVTETVILIIMVFRVLNIYFNGRGTERRLLEGFLSSDRTGRMDRLERLFGNIMLALNERRYTGLDRDVSILIWGLHRVETDNASEEDSETERFRHKVKELLLSMGNECPFVVGKVFESDWDFAPECDRDIILSEYLDYLRSYESVFNRVIVYAGSRLVKKDLEDIRLNANNTNVSGVSRFGGDAVLLRTGALKRYLYRYSISPYLIFDCIKRIDDVLEEERTEREGKHNQFIISFRNSDTILPLMDKNVWARFRELLDGYHREYPEADPDKKGILLRCIQGILCLAWMQELGESISLNEFRKYNLAAASNFEGFDLDPDEHKELYDMMLRYDLETGCASSDLDDDISEIISDEDLDYDG